MDLNIIEPIDCYEREFSNPDEWKLFYAKNKEAIDAQTTHKLNKRYNIEGYRITKIKGVLSLKKYDPSTKRYVSKADKAQMETESIKKMREEYDKTISDLTEDVEKHANEIEKLKTECERMRKNIAEQTRSINEIIKLINSGE